MFCQGVVFSQDTLFTIVPDTTNKIAIARNNLPVSEIDIPIVVDLRPVYQYADKMVDTLFTSPNYPQQWEMEGCDLRYQYKFNRGPLRFRTQGDKLMVSFTGYYGIRGSTRICTPVGSSPWTPPCSCGFGNEAPRKVDAGFVMQFRLRPDYQLQVNSVVINPVPADKCEVCFFGKDVTDKIVERVKAEVELSVQELKTTIAAIPLRAYMAMAWDSLQNGYQLPGFGNINFNPESLRFSSINTRNDSLFISIGLSARPELKGTPQIMKKPLPNLRDFSLRSGFNLYLAQLLPYDSLNTMINSRLAGKSFQVGKGLIKRTIQIDSAKLKGGDDRLFIEVRVSKAARGLFYLEGRPAWDSATQTVYLADLDFHFQSRQLLLRAASYLLDDFLLKKIGEYATFQLGEEETGLLHTANTQLNRELYPGVRSVGALNDLDVQQVTGAANGIFVQGALNGQLQIVLDAERLMKQFGF